MAPAWAWWVIEALAWAAALTIPGVTRERRLVTLLIFVGGFALGFVIPHTQPPGTNYVSYAIGPAAYAAGWITMRHRSISAYAALVAVPVITTVFAPFSPLVESTYQFGSYVPDSLTFDFMDALSNFTESMLPTVVAIVLAAGLAQKAPDPSSDQAGRQRWPYWLAASAFVAALFGAVLVVMPPGLAIVAIVLGHVGSVLVTRRGLGGRGLAITAYILGYLELIAFVWMLYQALLNVKIVF
jgi:hypothetical protein